MSQTENILDKKQNTIKEGIDHSKFYEWSKQFQYISSYQSNSSYKPNELRGDAIQGYKGFIPQIQSNNMFGQTFSRSARQVLASNISNNPFKLSSTGHNSLRHNYADQSLNAFTHKFGATTIQKNHPSLESNLRQSLYKEQFSKPVFNNESNQDFNVDDLNGNNNLSKKTLLSGFMKNNSIVGFKECLNSQLQLKDSKSEYNDKFQSKNRIHRDTSIFHIRNKSQIIIPA
ncbi:hypothetical protein ABPG72_010736 [Tetrahymena utriculariae]